MFCFVLFCFVLFCFVFFLSLFACFIAVVVVVVVSYQVQVCTQVGIFYLQIVLNLIVCFRLFLLLQTPTDCLQIFIY